MSIPLHSLMFEVPEMGIRIRAPTPEWSDAMIDPEELQDQLTMYVVLF